MSFLSYLFSSLGGKEEGQPAFYLEDPKAKDTWNSPWFLFDQIL